MEVEDIDAIVNYWHRCDNTSLLNMGVDKNKLPPTQDLTQMLVDQLNTPFKTRQSYCIIWQIDGKPVGHCNTNPTIFGEEAFMHLHIWYAEERQKGVGTIFLKMTLPYFFERLQIKKLLCQPYALNPAPNKTLAKAGFEFVKEYITIPGYLNFEQAVKQWQLTLEKFRESTASSSQISF